MTPIAVVRAEALFTSRVQPSDKLDPHAIRVAVVGTERRVGISGCIECVATEFGEHPDTAAARMAWAIAVIAVAFPTPRRRHNATATRSELVASA